MMRFNTLLINAVEKCNIRCRHCGYADSRRSLVMAAEDLADWATQAVEYGIRQVNFSGGEVFTRPDLLRAGVEAVHRAGGRSGVFTNGFWGTTEDDALRMLETLPGLTHLHMGCDVYHLEWVPAESLRNIIRAARRLPEPPRVILNICYATEEDRLQVARLFEDFADTGEGVAFHYQAVIPSAYVDERVPDARSGGRPLSSLVWGDSCYLHTPTVHTTGHVWACHIGTIETHPSQGAAISPFLLGNLKEEPLRDIFERAETNAIYQLLRACGPRCVAEAALAAGDGTADPRFTSDCDMCYQLVGRPEVVEGLLRRAEEPATQQEVLLSRLLIWGEVPGAMPPEARDL